MTAAAACYRSLTPARHAAETLQRHQRDAEVAAGRQVEEAGAEAVIDSAHQDDQGDDPPEPQPDAKAGDAGPADTATESKTDGSGDQRTPTESKPDGSDKQPAPAEAPAGLARIRTAAANATSRLLGVTRAIGGATAPTTADAEKADQNAEPHEKSRDTPDAGAHP